MSFVSLTHTCSGYCPDALTPTLTTTALYRSSLEWFEARFWKPTPKGLPSSLVQLMHKVSVHVHIEPPFLCAPVAHLQCSSGRAPTEGTGPRSVSLPAGWSHSSGRSARARRRYPPIRNQSKSLPRG